MRSISSRISVMSGEGALSVFARAKELEAQGRSIIHLELGEPDFHPGASVIESAAECVGRGQRPILRGDRTARAEAGDRRLSGSHAAYQGCRRECGDRAGMQDCAIPVDDGAARTG